MPDAVSNFVDTTTSLASNVKSGLKSAGVDTDAMATAAKEQATDLQRLIVAEIGKRPWHALGAAALLGYWLIRR